MKSLLNKPELTRKLMSFRKYVLENKEIGIKQRGIDMNLNNACNLRCKHCFTNSPKGEHAKDRLSIDVIERVANEAHDLGIFEWDMQGGELLLFPEKLYEALTAIKTERFYVYVTTNGFFMTQEIANELARLGVNRVSVSLDSFSPQEHDEFRGRKNSWQKGINALEMVQKAGMTPYLNITVGHYNAKSEDVRNLLDYSKKNRYKTLINVATPSGMWSKLQEIMIDDVDREHLIQLRKEYKNLVRNLWDPFDKEMEGVIGCNTINRLYITPLGDVLPCPYVHIRIGNVLEESLLTISERGFQARKFRDNSKSCLAGEDKDFVSKFLNREKTSIFNPIAFEEAFSDEDLYGEKERVYLPVVN